MPFVKGKSGNPGGRPKRLSEVRELARSYGPEAIRKLVSIMRDEKAHHRDQIVACGTLLDRGYGRAINAVDMAALTHAAGKNSDGGEVTINIGFGREGGPATLDLTAFAAQATPEQQPRDVTPKPQLEDRRPVRVSPSAVDEEKKRQRQLEELKYELAVREGRVMDLRGEDGWSHELPPRSG
jgi:hypothetical protein